MGLVYALTSVGSPMGFQYALKIVGSLVGIFGLMFLMFAGMKWFNKRGGFGGIGGSGGFGGGSGRMRIVDRVALGRDSTLIVASVCGKLMLIGVSSQRVEKLADLDVSEEEYVEAAFAVTKNEGKSFADVLSGFVRGGGGGGGKKAENGDSADNADNSEKSEELNGDEKEKSDKDV